MLDENQLTVIDENGNELGRRPYYRYELPTD